MTERDVLGDAIKDAHKFNNWVKKNWFTMIGIIVVLLAVWYDLATIQTQKVEVAKACNDHWHEQLRDTCTTLDITGNTTFDWNKIQEKDYESSS